MKIYWNGERKNVIGSRVKELRKKQDISQKILAARLSLSGIDFTELTILRIEKGTRFVPDYELSVIADYFHGTSDYLFCLTDNQKLHGNNQQLHLIHNLEQTVSLFQFLKLSIP